MQNTGLTQNEPTDHEEMASVISRLRRSQNRTQKELAEKLGVTDKAVSKWERGLGYPDIKIIPELAKELGITSNELLGGSQITEHQSEPEKTEQIVRNTLRYADQNSEQKKIRVSHRILTIITILFLTAIVACVICDIAVTNTLSWSVYVISSVIFAWFIAAPVLHFKKYRFLFSMVSLSILTIPLLAVIEKTSHSSGWLIPIGIPCTVTSLLYLWIVCCLFTFTKTNRWYLSSCVVAVATIVQFRINAIVDRALPPPSGTDVWDYFAAVCILILAAVLGLLGKHFHSDSRPAPYKNRKS